MKASIILLALSFFSGCVAPALHSAQSDPDLAPRLRDLGVQAIIGRTIELTANGPDWQLASVHISPENLTSLGGAVPLGYEITAQNSSAAVMLAISVTHGRQRNTTYRFNAGPANVSVLRARTYTTTDQQASFDIAFAVAANGSGKATLRFGAIPSSLLDQRWRGLPAMFAAPSTPIRSEASGQGLWAGTLWNLTSADGIREDYIAGTMVCKSLSNSIGEGALDCTGSRKAGPGIAAFHYDSGAQQKAWTWKTQVQSPSVNAGQSGTTVNSGIGATDLAWGLASEANPGLASFWDWQQNVVDGPLSFSFQRNETANLTPIGHPTMPGPGDQLEAVEWGWFGGDVEHLLDWT